LEGLTLKIKTLLNADRATFYLVDFERSMLHSKLAQSDGEPLEIHIPINSGIAGRVALTGLSLNVPDAYSHPSFNREVDQETGYRTRSVLCVPICDSRSRVFAVAELLNKKDGKPFTEADAAKLTDFSNALGAIAEIWTRLNAR